MRLVGLSLAALNGCEGVAGQTDAASGRVCVRLTAPHAAVMVHPAGVKVRASSLAPAQSGASSHAAAARSDVQR